MYRVVPWLVLLVAAGGCGARHAARTLGPGNTEVRGSIGGPVVKNLGVPLPVPLVRIGARHGVTERFDLAGGLHATAAAFGTFGADAGGYVQLWRRDGGLAVAASAHVNLFVGTRELRARAFPELGLHAAHPLSPRWTAVGGVDALAQLSPPDGKPPVLLAPYLGFEHRVAGGRGGLSATIAWISPWEDSTSALDYAPGDAGAFALQLGYRHGGAL